MPAPKAPRWISYLNPKYHVVKIVEDAKSCIASVAKRDAFGPDLDPFELAKALRGRLFGSFFVGGGFSWLGFLLGAAIQAKTGSPWLGLASTIILGQITSTLAFQAVWWMHHGFVYRASGRGLIHAIWEMQRDLWPVHSGGFRLALSFGVLTIPLNSLWLLALITFVPNVAQTLPAGTWVYLFDAILVHTTFIRLMGDFFERYSYVLADRFRPRLASA